MSHIFFDLNILDFSKETLKSPVQFAAYLAMRIQADPSKAHVSLSFAYIFPSVNLITK